MKILFLTHSFPRFSGDAPGSFLLRLARALQAEDVEVRVIAPSAKDLALQEQLEGITVERFRYAPRSLETLAYTGRMADDVSSSWTARAALAGYMGSGMTKAIGSTRRFKPDVLHAHWWFPSGVIGRVAARVVGAPLVTTLHGTDVRLARKFAAGRPLLRSVLRRSARVTTVSSWLASEVRELVSDICAEVAPMPAATERFGPAGSREANRFLFAGRLNRQKGLEHLLKAFAVMKRPAMLDVVGEGNEGQSLRLLASQLGISDRVVWHGQVDQPSLARFYQRATAVVVPSVDEGLGLVAAEAQLSETPVVAFRSGGLTDVVQHGTTGILVTPGDTSELAHALDSVLSSPEHAGELGRAGRMFALSAFSPESAAKRYAAIYRSVVAQRAA